MVHNKNRNKCLVGLFLCPQAPMEQNNGRGNSGGS